MNINQQALQQLAELTRQLVTATETLVELQRTIEIAEAANPNDPQEVQVVAEDEDEVSVPQAQDEGSEVNQGLAGLVNAIALNDAEEPLEAHEEDVPEVEEAHGTETEDDDPEESNEEDSDTEEEDAPEPQAHAAYNGTVYRSSVWVIDNQAVPVGYGYNVEENTYTSHSGNVHDMNHPPPGRCFICQARGIVAKHWRLHCPYLY